VYNSEVQSTAHLALAELVLDLLVFQALPKMSQLTNTQALTEDYAPASRCSISDFTIWLEAPSQDATKQHKVKVRRLVAIVPNGA
jgi:hypothetical protein